MMRHQKLAAGLLLLVALCPSEVSAIFLVDEGISKCEGADFNSRVVQGDYNPINVAFEERSLMCLWHYFVSSSADRYGRGWNDNEETEFRKVMPEEKRLEMNRTLKKLTGDYLRELPGHAEYVDQWIDKTWEAQRAPSRENVGLHHLPVAPYFMALVNLGSPECVEVLLGHLEDERTLGQNSAGRNPTPLGANWFQLIDVLGYAHDRGKQPWAGLPLRQGGGLKAAEVQRKMLKEWWASPASAPFKLEKNKASAKSPVQGESVPGLDDGWTNSKWPGWILIMLCAGGVVVGALFAARKRKN